MPQQISLGLGASNLIRISSFGLRISAVLAAALFVYGYRVWDAPLDRTEPHRALVAHGIVQHGNWLLPRLNGELYLRKPPLVYWAEAAAEIVTGRAEPWVWRLPSVLGSACLAAVVAAWAGRWFGVGAIGPAGLAVLAVVPLFDQDRAADIDALNTAAAVVTALLALEILYGRRRRAWPWVVGLGVSTGAMLLLKGPGGLPPVLGALVGPSVVLRDWRWVRRPGVWVGLLIGSATFATYLVAAKVAVTHAGLHAETSGGTEALRRMVLHRWRDVLPAVVAPFTVLLYALPVSAAVLFALRPPPPGTPGGGWGEGLRPVEDRSPLGDPHPNPLPGYRGRGTTAILATIAAGFLLFVAAGNGNPRYEYVLLPLLGMVVGAVATSDRSTAGDGRLLRVGLAAAVVLWVGLQLTVTANVWPAGVDRVGLAVAAVASVAAAVGWFRLGRPIVLAGLVVALVAVPLADRKNLERQRRSTRGVAVQLRAIVGDGPVCVASENRDVPELFYYAGVPVRAFGESGLAALAAAPGGRWVVLGQNKMFPEFRTLTAQVPGAFPRGWHTLRLPKGDAVYVGWYDPPAGTSPVVTGPRVADPDADEE